MTARRLNQHNMSIQDKIQRQYFNNVADIYYNKYHRTPFQMEWDRTFYEYVRKHGFKRPSVLEIGCGTGNIARLFSPEEVRYYVGVDLADGMLRFARQECAWGMFAAGSIFSLPFVDESFDVIIVAGTLHHMHDGMLPDAFTEITRVLRPHGHLYGREPVAQGDYQLASVSPNLSLSLMSLSNWIYRKTRTLVDREPPMEGYHTSYTPPEFFEYLQQTTLKIEDFTLKFPVSPFIQHAGMGAIQPDREQLEKLSRVVADADKALESGRRYGNEIFYRAVKHNYDARDTLLSLDQFLAEKDIPSRKIYRVLLRLYRKIMRIRGMV